MSSYFGEIWRYGRRLAAFDKESTEGREFRGFLEHSGLAAAPAMRSKAGLVPKERFRLISEPAESFSAGAGTRIVCEGVEFELLSVAEVYTGCEISHRECVLRRMGQSA